ncbi:MAG: hypothetical protein E6Q97_22165 [Desulfurellales bacterium]|nr:MAG: hypothetical protein E6Q97_22165 [Desulfurellales bacterium]
MNTIERKIITYFINRAKMYGWQLHSVTTEDGENSATVSSVEQALAEARQLDDALICFRQHAPHTACARKGWVRFIFSNGNRGRDVLADASSHMGGIVEQTNAYSETL